MYHALEIQEILTDIFNHCQSSDLAVLARTCRAFKELALDMLWEELHDLSPLARCLPEASHDSNQSSYRRVHKYSFTRQLTQAEWDILQSYTCRIRCIRHFEGGLGHTSFRILSKPHVLPLFPNLRHMFCEYTKNTMLLLHIPFPSLVSLDVRFETPLLFQDSLMMFPVRSPNIRKIKLCINVYQIQNAQYGSLTAEYVGQWRNLQTLDCAGLGLNADALVHLSRVPSLTQLTFTLSATLDHVSSSSPLLFSNLHELTLHSLFLDQISKLLSRIRLPAVVDLAALVENSPSKQDLSSFSVIQASSVGHTIETLRLTQTSPFPTTIHIRMDAFLGLEDLRPSMTFSNLRCFDVNVGWSVGLTDGELLALASAWPQLETLFFNASWGWSSSGITLYGLARLLETCQSLSQLAVAVDTRDYSAGEGLPASLGWTRPELRIDVLDSVIEVEVVPAVSTFFTSVATCTTRDFSIRAWECRVLVRYEEVKEYQGRWAEVRGQVAKGVAQWLDVESDSN